MQKFCRGGGGGGDKPGVFKKKAASSVREALEDNVKN